MSGWYQSFFQCTEDDCGFVFTDIGNEDAGDIEVCPVCQGSIDYAYNETRTKFAKELLKELKIMEATGELE